MTMNKPDFYWYEEGGYLVVDLDRAPVIYLANGTFGALFIHGREVENLKRLEIEHEVHDVPHVTMEVLGKGRDD